MNLRKSACTLLPLYVLAFLRTVICSELVPVYMWETTKTNERVSAITRVNPDTFTEILFERIEKTNPFIVVFAEENLSPEDFIEQHKKTFPHLSKFAASSQVTYLPLVEDPVETIKNIPNKEYSEISVTDLTNDKALPQSDVVIVNLNDAQEDEDRNDMLIRHDLMINNLYSNIVKEHEQVLVIFTGCHSSWIVPEQVKNQRQSRSLKADPDPEDKRNFQKNENFMIFVNDSIVRMEGENKSDTYEILKLTQSDSSIPSWTLEMSKDKVETSFTFNFNINASGYWILESFKVDSGNETEVKNIYAPMSFSYHCNDMVFVINENVSYVFPGLQMQIMPEDDNRTIFGDAYDCVGFTTAPIWSGLFVTFILALIMTLGLTMMMDIKTMDRFDDPKGKTIIINASE